MWIDKIKYSIVLLACLFATSCITNKDTQYLQSVKKDYQKNEPVDYKVKVGDELVMQFFSANPDVLRVFSNNTTNRGVASQQGLTYRVYDDGTIDIPFIQKIPVVGLTLREVETEIETRFKEYVNDPVAVKAAITNRYFYVIGESNKKGQYQIYKDNMNIFEAVAMCGDLGITADRSEVNIIRKTGTDKEKLIKFDLRSKNIVDSEYYYIQPDDIIYAGRSTNSFFRMTSFTSFLGVITSSLSFVLLVLQ